MKFKIVLFPQCCMTALSEIHVLTLHICTGVIFFLTLHLLGYRNNNKKSVAQEA